MPVDTRLLSPIKARKPRFFEGLTPSDIATILVPTTRRTFLANTIITDEGRAAIRSFGERFPRLHENGAQIAFKYLVAYNQRLVAATCKTAPQRLAEVLVNHANEIGRRGPDGIEIEVTNEVLAGEASITIYTTSRLMTEWQREGLILKSRGVVVVRSPEELMRLKG